MAAWAKDQEISKAKGLISFMGDPTRSLTTALDLELNHAGPEGVGIIGRGQRAALYVEDGEIKAINVAANENDPAGDAEPTSTLAPAMLDAVKAL